MGTPLRAPRARWAPLRELRGVVLTLFRWANLGIPQGFSQGIFPGGPKPSPEAGGQRQRRPPGPRLHPPPVAALRGAFLGESQGIIRLFHPSSHPRVAPFDPQPGSPQHLEPSTGGAPRASPPAPTQDTAGVTSGTATPARQEGGKNFFPCPPPCTGQPPAPRGAPPSPPEPCVSPASTQSTGCPPASGDTGGHRDVHWPRGCQGDFGDSRGTQPACFFSHLFLKKTNVFLILDDLYILLDTREDIYYKRRYHHIYRNL